MCPKAQEMGEMSTRKRIVFIFAPMFPQPRLAPLFIEVREMPTLTLACIGHVGPYAGNSGLFGRLFGRVCQWAGPLGLLHHPGTETICVYHDNPEVTPVEKLRISIGLTVPATVEESSPVHMLEIPAGKYVSARFDLLPHEFRAAWAYVTHDWMVMNNFQMDSRPNYESFLNDPALDPKGRCTVEIRCSIKPL